MTDEHLAVIDGISVFEDVKESSEGRVIRVEELLDGIRRVVLGNVPEGQVRRGQRRIPGLRSAPFGIWTWWRKG